MSPREEENYLARLHGRDTIDNLREDLNELDAKFRIYEQVLRTNGLFETAELRIKQAKDASLERDRQFREWRTAHPEEELAFE